MKKYIRLLLINIIPFLFLIMHIEDVHSAYYHAGSYPFGSNLGAYSIYNSQEIYVTFGLFCILFLVLLIISSIIKKWILYRILLFINIVFFIISHDDN
jgi:hypothetical protein